MISVRSVMCSFRQANSMSLFFPGFAGSLSKRRHRLQVLTHSCGSVHLVIGRLIDAGVQCLHPLQAKAFGMDAETLVRDFGGKIAFLGGIDTQELLIKGTPEEIRREVRRLKGVFGHSWIASPSHEALLPDIPPRNVVAMAEAVLES
jgi:uroporphyrinogen decarboxylase